MPSLVLSENSKPRDRASVARRLDPRPLSKFLTASCAADMDQFVRARALPVSTLHLDPDHNQAQTSRQDTDRHLQARDTTRSYRSRSRATCKPPPPLPKP